MRSFSTIAAAAFISLASAQTWTDCNPLEKTCAPNPALSDSYEHTFGDKAPLFTTTFDSLVYGGDDGVAFRVAKSRDAPTIASNFFIMFGKVEVTLKAAPGQGVVSSVVLQSDDLDEIDWEWVGSKPDESQSNYFGKGVTDGYNRGGVHPGPTQDKHHVYGLDWTPEKIDWLIDGAVVRTLLYTDNPKYFPQTPCNVRIGAWAAGDPDNEKGTIQWAGGEIDYTKGPYDMMVKRIYVQDYSNGTEYVYGDKSGSWESIKAVDGTVNAGPQSNTGNVEKLMASSGGSSNTDTIVGSSQFKAPSNSGLVMSSSTVKSKATSTIGSSAANTVEAARSISSSGSSGSASGSGFNGPAATTSSTNGQVHYTGAASTLDTLPVVVLAVAGLVTGLVL